MRLPEVEYRVDHPRWRLRQACEARFEGDAALLYGPRFVDALSAPPTSAFLVDGSAVNVFRGVRIEDSFGPAGSAGPSALSASKDSDDLQVAGR